MAPLPPLFVAGLRGIAYFFLEVEGGTKDLHSGVHGGPVAEAMNDVVRLMSRLVDDDGTTAVRPWAATVLPVHSFPFAPFCPSVRRQNPGPWHLRPSARVYRGGKGEAVVGVLLGEGSAVLNDGAVCCCFRPQKTYDSIDFDPVAYKGDAGVKALRPAFENNKPQILASRWRLPSLSLHGIEGAFSGKGSKTVIPGKVIGKFSIRMVPDMDPAKVEELVRAHVEAEFAKLNSPNKIKVSMGHAGRAWLSNYDSPNYVAARTAVKAVHGQEPDLIREGGSIPITLIFQEATGEFGCQCGDVCNLMPHFSAVFLLSLFLLQENPCACCPLAAVMTVPTAPMRSLIAAITSTASRCWEPTSTLWLKTASKQTVLSASGQNPIDRIH